MIASEKIKGKMKTEKISIEKMAQCLGINRSTLYRKLNNKKYTLTVGEAAIIAKELGLTKEEVNEYFFAQNVAICDNGGNQ